MGATSVYRPLNFRALPDTVLESCELTCVKSATQRDKRTISRFRQTASRRLWSTRPRVGAFIAAKTKHECWALHLRNEFQVSDNPDIEPTSPNDRV
jgi:hypothetical protein